MAAKTETKNTGIAKKTIKFSDKFGLDKDRKKLGATTNEKANPPVFSPGKNFAITKIVITSSKKKYQATTEEGEITKTKIPIAQFDVVHEDGTTGKYYSPNSAIVEACENILKDPDFQADPKTGDLAVPAQIAEVIEGKGDSNHNYIAFA